MGVDDFEEMDCEKYFSHKGTKTLRVRGSGFKVEGFTPSRKGREGIRYRRQTIEDRRKRTEFRVQGSLDMYPISTALTVYFPMPL
ncbi:hypothetical protein BPIT_28740 [Candidatus Brocadia pituitae]|nr:hypothetical protein BPIT_28740 [Candidatus Brocadia pituitae]